MINDDTTHLPDLDAMLERARIEAAASRSSDSAQAHVVRILAETEGFASVAQLLRDGYPGTSLPPLPPRRPTSVRRPRLG